MEAVVYASIKRTKAFVKNAELVSANTAETSINAGNAICVRMEITKKDVTNAEQKKLYKGTTNVPTESINAYAKNAAAAPYVFIVGRNRIAEIVAAKVSVITAKFGQCALGAAVVVSVNITNKNMPAPNASRQKSVNMISFGQIAMIVEENHIANTKNNDRCARNVAVAVCVIMVKTVVSALGAVVVVCVYITVREQTAKTAVEEASANIKKSVRVVRIAAASNTVYMKN